MTVLEQAEQLHALWMMEQGLDGEILLIVAWRYFAEFAQLRAQTDDEYTASFLVHAAKPVQDYIKRVLI